MIVYKLWQLLIDVLSSRQTFDMFVIESCGKKKTFASIEERDRCLHST